MKHRSKSTLSDAKHKWTNVLANDTAVHTHTHTHITVAMKHRGKSTLSDTKHNWTNVLANDTAVYTHTHHSCDKTQGQKYSK